jgi:hypothetical protein
MGQELGNPHTPTLHYVSRLSVVLTEGFSLEKITSLNHVKGFIPNKGKGNSNG